VTQGDEVVALVDAHLRRSLGDDPVRASVTFLGMEPIEVLRFERGDAVHYATLGMSRFPMADPATVVVDSVTGPRAELVLSLADRHDSVLRTLATLAAAPAVEGLVVSPGALLDVDRPLWDDAPYRAVLVGEPSPLVTDLVLPEADGRQRDPVQFFPLTVLTAADIAVRRAASASDGSPAA
jgi:hypothetical protein